MKERQAITAPRRQGHHRADSNDANPVRLIGNLPPGYAGLLDDLVLLSMRSSGNAPLIGGPVAPLAGRGIYFGAPARRNEAKSGARPQPFSSSSSIVATVGAWRRTVLDVHLALCGKYAVGHAARSSKRPVAEGGG